MSAVTLELENTLKQLDAASARSLERVVWDVLRLAKQRQEARPVVRDNNGYPAGHFERLTGSWAEVTFALPDDPPPRTFPRMVMTHLMGANIVIAILKGRLGLNRQRIVAWASCPPAKPESTQAGCPRHNAFGI